MPREWNYNTLQVLHSVAKGARYGFDIMDVTGLKSGQVYRALNKLEEARLVASEWEDPDAAVQQKRPRRRYYAISQEGRSTLRDVAVRYSVFASIGETDEARV